MDSFSRFIQDHAADRTDRLLLSRATRWPEADPLEEDYPEGTLPATDVKQLAVNTLEVRTRLRAKVPAWAENPELVYPTRLSGEQCSSQETARMKARIAADILAASEAAPRIADLTGGLGVDSWAFSEVSDAVLYNEADPLLAAAARHNFRALGTGSVRVSCATIRPGETARILDGFQPGLLYLDPARRDGCGRKVFRLEDCTPDLSDLQEELLAICPRMLLKLSPMADLSYLADCFGEALRAAFLLEAAGECKELLVWLGKKPKIGVNKNVISGNSVVSQIDNKEIIVESSGRRLIFGWNEEKAEKARLSDEKTTLDTCLSRPETRLFEPGKALRKAGFFHTVARRFSLTETGRDAHLFLSDGPVPEALSPFGKSFRIRSVFPLADALRTLPSRRLRAGVSARGLALDSEALRRRLKVSGEDAALHLFGLRADCADGTSHPLLLVCERV